MEICSQGELPITESHYTVPQLSPSLELGVRYRHDIHLRQRMADESLKMLRKGAKRIIAALVGHMLVMKQTSINAVLDTIAG